MVALCRKIHVSMHEHPDIEDSSWPGLYPGSRFTGGSTVSPDFFFLLDSTYLCMNMNTTAIHKKSKCDGYSPKLGSCSVTVFEDWLFQMFPSSSRLVPQLLGFPLLWGFVQLLKSSASVPWGREELPLWLDWMLLCLLGLPEAVQISSMFPVLDPSLEHVICPLYLKFVQ